MKKSFKYILTSVILMTVCTACSAQRLFGEASKFKSVETVYISKALCNLGIEAADLDDLQEGIKQLDGVEILNCEESADIPQVSKICNDIIQQSGAELLMSADDDGEQVAIYGNPNADLNTLSSLFIVSSEPEEFSLVYIKGKFDLKKIISAKQSQATFPDDDN